MMGERYAQMRLLDDWLALKWYDCNSYVIAKKLCSVSLSARASAGLTNIQIRPDPPCMYGQTCYASGYFGPHNHAQYTAYYN